MYRIAIKTALSIRSNTNNEIVYLESGLYPLEATIRRRQLAFWLRTKEAANNNAVIRYVVETAIRHNVEYITFYKELEEQYKTPTNCQLEIEREYKRKCSRKISDAATQDTNSKLGAYYEINPDCDNIQYDKLHELERITITRYRTGSHNLRIETGRHTNPITPREQRLCACGTEIQTLKHIVIECGLL